MSLDGYSMLLYHYTTLDGALGILTTRTFRASSIRHLNDSSELRYAIDLAFTMFKVDSSYSDLDRQFWFSDLGEGTSYVVSFSAFGDQLSQWRAYGSPGCGISLGFDSDLLERAVAHAAFRLKPCVYDPAEQRQMLLSAKGDGSAKTVAHAIVNLAPRMKHPKFSEEAESRLISGVPPEYQPPCFRHSGAMLIPFKELYFDTDEPNTFPLREVIIGPSPHPAENVFSVRLLLAKLRLDAELRQSEIPFRNR